MLTARDQREERVEALDQGADDHSVPAPIPQPFERSFRQFFSSCRKFWEQCCCKPFMLSTPMTSLNNRLQLALLNRNKGKSVLEKGFTLVELMIVIVIVGILSAVALPNFLSQTERAKATEGTSKLSGLLKEAHAEYQLAGTEAAAVTEMSTSIANANAGSIFTFALTAGSGEISGTATGNTSSSSNFDASIQSKLLHGCVNVTTGKTDISSRLLASGTSTDVNCS